MCSSLVQLFYYVGNCLFCLRWLAYRGWPRHLGPRSTGVSLLHVQAVTDPVMLGPRVVGKRTTKKCINSSDTSFWAVMYINPIYHLGRAEGPATYINNNEKGSDELRMGPPSILTTGNDSYHTVQCMIPFIIS